MAGRAHSTHRPALDGRVGVSRDPPKRGPPGPNARSTPWKKNPIVQSREALRSLAARLASLPQPNGGFTS
jgi:hypothetical protein